MRAKLQLVSLHNRRLFIKPQYVYKIINNINCPKQLTGYLIIKKQTKTSSILQWSNIIRSTTRLRLNVDRPRLSSRLRVPGTNCQEMYVSSQHLHSLPDEHGQLQSRFYKLNVDFI